MNVRLLHHIGIAVPSLEAAIPLWTSFVGSDRLRTDIDTDQGVEVTFVETGAGGIELLAPIREDSVIARFLERRGPGLHHVCFEVEDLRRSIANLSAAGFSFTEAEPRIGAFGHRIAFIHPRSAGGVLVELLERADADPATIL